MAFSVVLELDDGGTAVYDNVVAFTVEENAEPSPDEVPEDGDEEREGNDLEAGNNAEVDLSEEVQTNPMEETEEEKA